MDRLLGQTAQHSGHAAAPGGFTLLEVMVALAVLATTLTVIYQLHGQTMMISSNARFYNLAPTLAQAKLSEVEQSTYEELAESTGDFGEDYPGLQWSVLIEDVSTDLLEAKPYHFARIEIVVSNDDESTYNLRTYRFFVD
jgi:general secretion pathway protein I